MRVKERLLIVDGYNMIGSWPHLLQLKNTAKMEDARDALCQDLSWYAQYKSYTCKVVFDAQFVPGIEQHYDFQNVEVIFTKEDETADSYIERTADDVNQLLTQVIVATSDLAVQTMMLSKKATRKSARELYNDIQEARQQLEADVGNQSYRLGVRRHSPWKDKDQETLSRLYEDLIRKRDQDEE